VNETGSGACLMAGFCINGVESWVCTVKMLVD
jgi:hypothetical protein